MHTQEYADDFVTLIRDKRLCTCLGVMQTALIIVEGCCEKEGLSVAPLKTAMVIFSKRRTVECIDGPLWRADPGGQKIQ